MSDERNASESNREMPSLLDRLRHGWPTTPLCAEAGAEIERLRHEVRRQHKLNGWSKQKGWWCSCGAPIWSRFTGYVDDQGKDIVPWSEAGRARVLPEHAEHVRRIVEGS